MEKIIVWKRNGLSQTTFYRGVACAVAINCSCWAAYFPEETKQFSITRLYSKGKYGITLEVLNYIDAVLDGFIISKGF